MLKNKLFGLAALSLISISLMSCGLEHREAVVYDWGYFQYIHIGDNSIYQDKNDRSLVIVGFTESGLEQERLDMPRKLGKFDVKRIGLKDSNFYHLNDRNLSCGEKLKKLFIFDNIEKIENFYATNVDVFYNSETYFLEGSDDRYSYKHIYFYKPLWLELGYRELYASSDNYVRRHLPANVNFMNNYPIAKGTNLYRIDNIEKSEKLIKPDDPILENYTFKGWYLEPECINQFDFDTAPTIEEDSTLDLYASWEANN